MLSRRASPSPSPLFTPCGLALSCLLLSGAALAAPDAGMEVPDAGKVLFGVSQREALQKSDVAMQQAGDGLRSYLPAAWLAPSVGGLQRWQWLAVPLLGALIFGLTLVLVRLTTAVLRHLRRKQLALAEKIVAKASGPLKLGWGALLGRLALPLLDFPEHVAQHWERGLRVGLGGALFWGGLRAVTAWRDNFETTAFAQQRPGSRALVGLLSGVARFALVAMAVLASLAELDYSVTSLVAGVGIGGLALALGAQKTLENVFGAFALAVDQPIREGEFVRIDDFVGTVETIGLRSTRVRTLDRTLISIPNGKLAEMRTETFGARDRIRLSTVVGVSYATTAAQMKQVIDGFRAVLRGQEKIWPDAISVQFVKLGECTLDIEVMAWFVTTSFDEFKAIREEVLLGFMAAVETAGTSIAFPTRTLHLVGEAAPPAREPTRATSLTRLPSSRTPPPPEANPAGDAHPPAEAPPDRS